MTPVEEQTMGRFSAELELANDEDVVLANAGSIPAANVRRTRVRGVVDSGAARLVVPESVAQQLGVPISGAAQVRYADGRTAHRSIARRLHLSYGGREGIFNAIVEPARDSALIGAIVLEDLDLAG